MGRRAEIFPFPPDYSYEPMFCTATAFLGSYCMVVGFNLVWHCVKKEYFAPNFLPGKMVDDPETSTRTWVSCIINVGIYDRSIITWAHSEVDGPM